MNDTIFSYRGDEVLRASWTEATGVGGAEEGTTEKVGDGREEALIEFYKHLRRSERIWSGGVV